MNKAFLFLLLITFTNIYTMKCDHALFSKEDLTEEEQEFQTDYWNSKKCAYNLANKIGIATFAIGTTVCLYHKVTSPYFSFISGVHITGFTALVSLGMPLLVHKCKYNYKRFKRGLI